MKKSSFVVLAVALLAVAGLILFLVQRDTYRYTYKDINQFKDWLKKSGHKVQTQGQVAPVAKNIYRAHQGLIMAVDSKVHTCYLFKDEAAWNSLEESQRNIHQQFKSKAKNKASIVTYDNVRCFEM